MRIAKRQDCAAKADGGECETGSRQKTQQNRAARRRSAARFQRSQHNARSCDDNCGNAGDCHRITKHHQSKSGDLQRFGLGVGNGQGEGALAHRAEHQPGSEDLRYCAKQHKGPE